MDIDPAVATQEACREYARLLDTNDETERFAGAAEAALRESVRRSTEARRVAEVLRSEAQVKQQTELPELMRQAEQLREVFEVVDRLEQVVDAVQGSVNKMEDRVAEAERAFQVRSLKKMFSFSSEKKREPVAMPAWVPVDDLIVNTDDLFQRCGLRRSEGAAPDAAPEAQAESAPPQ